MYDHFVGQVCEKAAARIVLRVAGIGYDLQVPLSTSSGLRVGDETMLHTILHVVDGNPTLLGFADGLLDDFAEVGFGAGFGEDDFQRQRTGLPAPAAALPPQ